MNAQPTLTPAQIDNLRFAIRADRMAGSESARLEEAVLRIVAEDRAAGRLRAGLAGGVR